MKKFLLLFVATASLLISCDKNDDNNTVDNSTLLHGKWEVNDYLFEAKINGEVISTEEAGIEVEFQKGDVVEFKSNNIVITSTLNKETNQWESIEGTYVYNESNSKLSMTFFDEEDQTNYTEELNVLLLNSNQLNVDAYYSETFQNQFFEVKMELYMNKKK